MIFKYRDGSMELDIFRNFFVDEDLPKHFKESDPNDPMTTPKTTGFFPVSINSNFTSVDEEDQDDDNFSKVKKKNISFIKGLFKKKEKQKNDIPFFFKAVFNSAEQVEKFNTESKALLEQLQQAKALNQTALLEKLTKTLQVKLWENQLIVTGFSKYVSEANIIKFSLETIKGVRLDWIKNYARLIPIDVGKAKIEADKLKIFDNYVVMHYDPENKATQLTQQEIERRRDPILFGVIKGSRNLYFIGDWKDEFCELTLNDIVTKLGIDSELKPNGAVSNTELK